MFLTLGLLLLGLRALTQLRIFTAYRVLIELIRHVLGDMIPYATIIIMIIILTSVCYGVSHISGNKDFDIVSDEFLEYLGIWYQVILGENFYYNSMSSLHWGIYVLFTVLVNIMAMNLLIAILSNTYDNVMSSLDATHFKVKLNILNEIQDLMVWNRNKNELQYLHFVYYANEELNPSGQENKWEGRVRVMLNQIKEVKDACKVIQMKQEESTQFLKEQREANSREIEELKGHLERRNA